MVGIHLLPTMPGTLPWVHHHPPGVTLSAPAGLLVLSCSGEEALGSTPEIIREMRRREKPFLPKV